MPRKPHMRVPALVGTAEDSRPLKNVDQKADPESPDSSAVYLLGTHLVGYGQPWRSAVDGLEPQRSQRPP